MRNIDDRNALFLQFPDYPEKDVNLIIRQGRCRLIHDQDSTVIGKRFGYLDHLLLGNTQLFHLFSRVNIAFEFSKNSLRILVGLPIIEKSRPFFLRLPAYENILCHCQIRHQIKLLIYNTYPQFKHLFWM